MVDTTGKASKSPPYNPKSPREVINKYLEDKAVQQARDIQVDYSGTTIKKAVPYQTTGSISSIGARMRDAFGQGKDKPTVNLREKSEQDAVSKLFKALKPAKPPKFTPDPKTVKLPKEPLPFEGMHTSVLPKLDASGVPVEYIEAQKEQDKAAAAAEKQGREKYRNFQRLQDAVQRRRLQQLGSIERVGHNISQLGQRANAASASWPYIPGGFVLPFVLLLILFFTLIKIGGFTRIGWLWNVITGTAAVNPNYTPPETTSQGFGTAQAASGSGPSLNDVNYYQDVGAPVGLYNYVPLSMSAYMDDE